MLGISLFSHMFSHWLFWNVVKAIESFLLRSEKNPSSTSVQFKIYLQKVISIMFRALLISNEVSR